MLLEWWALWPALGWSFGPDAVLPPAPNPAAFLLDGRLPGLLWPLPLGVFALFLTGAWPLLSSFLCWVTIVGILHYLPWISHGTYGVCLAFTFCFFIAQSSRQWTMVWRGMHVLLSLVYLNSAYGKILTPEWVNGGIMRAVLGRIPAVAPLAPNTSLMVALSFACILLQGSHLLTVFLPGTRKLFLALFILMHAAVAVTLHHYTLSFLMAGLNLVFLAPPGIRDKTRPIRAWWFPPGTGQRPP